jgi:hypothetical protein
MITLQGLGQEEEGAEELIVYRFDVDRGSITVAA